VGERQAYDDRRGDATEPTNGGSYAHTSRPEGRRIEFRRVGILLRPVLWPQANHGIGKDHVPIIYIIGSPHSDEILPLVRFVRLRAHGTGDSDGPFRPTTHPQRALRNKEKGRRPSR
jgi:hypothetical protein